MSSPKIDAYASLLLDSGEIVRHVETVHAGAARACQHLKDPGLLQMSRLNPDSDKMEVLGRYRVGETERMAREAESAAEGGYNVYVECRTVRNSLPAAARGKLEDTVAVFALVADMDAYKGKVGAIRGAPIVIQSSPGNEHRWYFFDRALGAEEARALGILMRAASGGDANTGNVVQPYRVAGTPNYPTEKKRRELGREVTPTCVLVEHGDTYDPVSFTALWPAAKAERHAENEAADPEAEGEDDEADFDALLARCSQRLRKRLAEDDVTDRSGHFYNVTGFIRREGFTKAQAVILWEGHPGSAADKYEGRLAAEIDRAWGKVKDRPRKPRSNDVLTEDSAASQFAAEYGDLLRFDHDADRWFEWDGAHWRQAGRGLALHWARLLARKLVEDEDPKVRYAAGKASFAGSVERFARNDTVFAVTNEIWNRDLLLLGTPGGTVDLRTGVMREPEPSEYVSRLTGCMPADKPSCPRWIGFLTEALGGDTTMVRFLQQWCGYCLTGSTSEHALLFAYGPGGNGKSVFLKVIRLIFGSYAATAAMETFAASKFNAHPTEIAMLRGARIVTASETEKGHAWAESRIKSLTGGDPVTARFMRQDHFTFDPQFKLTIVGNHMPVLRNVDEASRRRFNIVPFTHVPKTKDKDLDAKLAAEGPAILRWMIEGCLDWQRNGLIRPAAVIAETEAYFADQDVFSQWFDERCEACGPMEFTRTAALFASWSSFARQAGEEIGTEKQFAAQMSQRGFPAVKTNKGRGYKAVRLLADNEFEGQDA